jgi:tripeptide aminopeptidase
MIEITAPILKNLLDLTCTLQAIPAPTFQEEQRAAFLLKQLPGNRSNGCAYRRSRQCDRQAAGQKRRAAAGDQRAYRYRPPYPNTADTSGKDRIIGPGIGDNALGVAAVITLLHLLKSRGRTARRSVGGNECLRRRTGRPARDASSGQPVWQPAASLPGSRRNGAGDNLHRGLGVERYKITVTTPGGHSWVDYGRPSAIHEISAIVTRLAAISNFPRNPARR